MAALILHLPCENCKLPELPTLTPLLSAPPLFQRLPLPPREHWNVSFVLSGPAQGLSLISCLSKPALTIMISSLQVQRKLPRVSVYNLRSHPEGGSQPVSQICTNEIKVGTFNDFFFCTDLSKILAMSTGLS